MKQFLKKLFIGKLRTDYGIKEYALHKAKSNFRSIWNNDHSEDSGLEKIVRLILAASLFLFPGIYLKELFGRIGKEYKELALDFFVLFKVIFPFLLLYHYGYSNDLLFYLVIWFLLETMLYVPTMIFASDVYSQPRSYRRSMLLLFFNYLEIVLSFAVIYARGDYFNNTFQDWIDPIYYSFITMSTIGYGDYYPISFVGKTLAIVQSIIYLAFVILFLNFFSHRMESKGYFENTNRNKDV